MEIHELTQPTTEPVTIAEARQQVRVLNSVHDQDLIFAISAARVAAETYINQIISPRTFAAVMPAFCDVIRLPGPLQSVQSVTYRDADGATQTLDPATYYVDRTRAAVMRSPMADWPAVGRYHDAVTINYTAGWAACPWDIQQAIRLLLTHFFENRGSENIAMPSNAEWLLRPYRHHNA